MSVSVSRKHEWTWMDVLQCLCIWQNRCNIKGKNYKVCSTINVFRPENSHVWIKNSSGMAIS